MYGDFAARLALDALAIAILAYAIYFRRHRRRDLVVAYVALNIGLLVVATVLFSASSGAQALGIGFGLFAVLSIIRLRSEEATYIEVAYFFSALALGLVNGVQAEGIVFTALLNLVVLGAMYAVDHPGLASPMQRQVVILDEVHTDPEALREAVAASLPGTVGGITVRETDLVRETMTLEVRWSPVAGAPQVPAAR
jgi:hypothetical protein